MICDGKSVGWRALATLAALGIVAGCSRDDTVDRNRSDGAEAATNVPLQVPQPTPLLDRAGLLDAIRAAAGAFAAGVDDRKVQTDLDGRRFAVRLAFACDGPVDEASTAPLRMTVRAGGRSIEVRAMPDPDVAGAAPDEGGSDNPAAIQSAEGFWFNYPWLLAEQCPAPRAVASREVAEREGASGGPPRTPGPDDRDARTVSVGERSAGIAQYFTSEDSRLRDRSGRGYSKVVPLAEGEAPPGGLFLLLEGRLRTWPDGFVIRCRAVRKAAQPSCVAAATIDRVAVERIDDRSILAEWTTG